MDTSAALTALSALAQKTRLKCFKLLAEHEPGGVPAGEIARLVGVPQNTMSTHLSILARASLVTSTRHSRMIIYRADLEAFHGLANYLLESCCGGRPELCTSGFTGAVPLSLPAKEPVG